MHFWCAFKKSWKVIKFALKITDNWDNEDYFQRPVGLHFAVAEDLDFCWEVTKLASSSKYVVLFGNSFLLLSEKLDVYDKIHLDKFSERTIMGEEVRKNSRWRFTKIHIIKDEKILTKLLKNLKNGVILME